MDYPKGYEKRPVWQLILVYLIVGGLIYAAIYYFYMSKKGNSPYSSAASTQTVYQNSITFSPSGFQPNNITIKAGDTVTWTNSSGNDVSINSNPHPVHTDYPPLNIGVVKNGATASLTFPTPGIYKYHNHFNASQYGSITVQ